MEDDEWWIAPHPPVHPHDRVLVWPDVSIEHTIMPFVLVKFEEEMTLPTSHVVMSWLNEVAPLNMGRISVTLEVSHFPVPGSRFTVHGSRVTAHAGKKD